MDSLIYVSGAIALLCLAALFIYLIKFLISARGLVDNSNVVLQDLSLEVKSIRVEAKETLDNIDLLIQNVVPTLDTLNDSLTKINQQLDSVDVITGHAKNVTSNIEKASEDISYAVSRATNVASAVVGVQQYFTKKDKPVQQKKGIFETINLFTALAKGISSFKKRYDEIELEEQGDKTRIYQNDGYDDVYEQ